MKKRYIIIPLIVMGLILLISPFILRVNAATIYRRYYTQNFYSNYQEIIVLNYADTDVSSNIDYPFFTFKFNDTDAPAVEVTRNLYARYTGVNQYTLFNGSTDTNVNFFSTNFYLLHLYKGPLNDFYIDFYEVDFDITDWRNNFYLTLSSSTPIYSYALNISFNEVVNGQIRLTYYGNIVSSYYDVNTSSIWTNGQLDNLLRTIKQYPYDSDLLGDIYSQGFTAGESGENVISPFLNYLNGVFSLVDSILSVEIVPRIKLWYFIALPLFFLIVWGVLKIWKHN